MSSVSLQFEDMYSTVKRQRRPVKRFMYEKEVPQTRSTKPPDSSSSDSDTEKEEDGGEEEGEEEREEGEDNDQTKKRYSLRNRRENRPFQIGGGTYCCYCYYG